MPELTEENLKQIGEKLEKMGLPDTFLPEIAEQAKNIAASFFHVRRELTIDQEQVKVVLGLQEKFKDYFMPDLLALSLTPHEKNLVNQNAFLLPSGADFTVKEAYNLMQGRAVRRPAGSDGEGSYWMRLSTEKSYHGIRMPVLVRGDLSVQNWLAQSPFDKTLTDEQKKTLITALHAGDRFNLTNFVPGEQVPIYMVTTPEWNQIELETGGRILKVTEHRPNSEHTYRRI
ncbi:MAG: hypothetical protein JST68_00470 [Bacteroidetes bacterium]|nr:hypothetical protein [Bacteroidota bacterium]